MRFTTIFLFLFISVTGSAQLQWQRVDSLYGPLPKSVHVYFTDDKVDTALFRAFYVIADLKDRKLDFTTDTTYKRRLTPQQFFQKNGNPLVVVNGTFFSFETNRNLNVVVKDGKAVSFNVPSVRMKSGDSTIDVRVFRSAIGITAQRKADVAWIRNDSSSPLVYASQVPTNSLQGNYVAKNTRTKETVSRVTDLFAPWKMQTAIGGGPVLLQNGRVRITNDIERMFVGKAINDKHPRTAMGYTKDNKLIILVVEGRNPKAGGATLPQLAKILQDLGCVEALNLDGGGSSCMLVNGKETIRPSDRTQRAVPAVFLVKQVASSK